MNKLDEKLIKKMDENLNKIKSIYEESMKIYQYSAKQHDKEEEFDPFAMGEGEPPFVSDDVLDEVHQEGMTPFPFLNTTVEDFAESIAGKIVERFKKEGYFSKDGTIHIVTDADDETESEDEVSPAVDRVKCMETRHENEQKEKYNELLTTSDIYPYVKVDNTILYSEDITAFKIKTEKPNGTHGKMKVFMTYSPHCMDHNIEKYATEKYSVDVKIANGKVRELGEFYVESFDMYATGYGGDIYYEIVLTKMI